MQCLCLVGENMTSYVGSEDKISEKWHIHLIMLLAFFFNKSPLVGW